MCCVTHNTFMIMINYQMYASTMKKSNEWVLIVSKHAFSKGTMKLIPVPQWVWSKESMVLFIPGHRASSSR